jgi:hypothetical protein
LNADCAGGLKAIALRNRRGSKTNAGGGSERSVLLLRSIEPLPSAIWVHLRNLHPKPSQHRPVSLPLWQPILDEHSSDFSPNSPDV